MARKYLFAPLIVLTLCLASLASFATAEAPALQSSPIMAMSTADITLTVAGAQVAPLVAESERMQTLTVAMAGGGAKRNGATNCMACAKVDDKLVTVAGLSLGVIRRF